MNIHILTPIPFSSINYHSPQMAEVERAIITPLKRRKGAFYHWQNSRGKPGIPSLPPHQLSIPDFCESVGENLSNYF